MMPEAVIQENLRKSRENIQTLRDSLKELLVARQINRIPYGKGEYLRIPNGIDELSAGEVLSLAEVVVKLTKGE